MHEESRLPGTLELDVDTEHFPPFLAGGGRATELIVRRDWSGHPLGQPADWPEGLKVALSLVVNSPESMILCWGPDLHFFFNETYIPLLGPRVEWAMGARFDEVWSDAVDQARPIIAAALAGNSQRFNDLPWKLGTDRGPADTWFTFSYSRILGPDGAVAGLFIFTNETTAKVLADAELREITDRQRQTLQQMPGFVGVLSGPDHRFDYVNDAFVEIAGRREYLGRTVREVFPELADQGFYQLLDQVWRTGEPFSAHAMPIRLEHRPPGETDRFIDLLYQPVRNAAGSITGIFVGGYDVTGQVRAQRSLAEANQDLEARVDAAMRDRMAAEEALRHSQKMEAVGQLTGGIAHDFNNLLTVISTSLQLLQKPHLADERRQRLLGSISGAVVRASRLTGQLLAFARRQTLQPVVFDAFRNVVSIREMLHTLTGSRLEISFESAGGEFLVDVDPAQFDAAIVNLVVNARDAMQQSGRIAIKAERVASIGADPSEPAVAGDFIAISVADTGTGIAPELLARVFEPFYTTKAVGHGTGLGLSQVFGFAKQSSGDVRVHSVVGEGTTFTVFLPVSRRPLQSHSTPVEPAASPARFGPESGRLLYVEDDPEVAAATVAILEDLGYAVVAVADGNDALARIATDTAGFAAVMSDVMMAPMDGVTLARRIATDHPHLPILLCSGYSSVLASTREHGFRVLPKPFSIEQLAQALRNLSGAPAAGEPEPAVAPIGTLLNADQEAARLAELRSLAVLDTRQEADYDEIVLLAATLFDAPRALITLVDEERQWFKARNGLLAQETPRIESVCSYAIRNPEEVMVVHDASTDPRFADNPAIRALTDIKFYAGAPLVTSSGHAIGTVCVIDTQPRDADPRQLVALKVLAKQVVERLERQRGTGTGAVAKQPG